LGIWNFEKDGEKNNRREFYCISELMLEIEIGHVSTSTSRSRSKSREGKPKAMTMTMPLSYAT
jgi:hypothetical protein